MKGREPSLDLGVSEGIILGNRVGGVGSSGTEYVSMAYSCEHGFHIKPGISRVSRRLSACEEIQLHS